MPAVHTYIYTLSNCNNVRSINVISVSISKKRSVDSKHYVEPWTVDPSSSRPCWTENHPELNELAFIMHVSSSNKNVNLVKVKHVILCN